MRSAGPSDRGSIDDKLYKKITMISPMGTERGESPLLNTNSGSSESAGDPNSAGAGDPKAPWTPLGNPNDATPFSLHSVEEDAEQEKEADAEYLKVTRETLEEKRTDSI